MSQAIAQQASTTKACERKLACLRSIARCRANCRANEFASFHISLLRCLTNFVMAFRDQFFYGSHDKPDVYRKLRARLAPKTLRRAEITWAHAAGIHDQLLNHQTGIDGPQLEHVITRLSYHMLRGQDAHAVFD